MNSSSWTPQHDERLRELWPYRRLKEMAMLLGCSVTTIRAHASLLGLTMADKTAYYHESLHQERSERAKATGVMPPYWLSKDRTFTPERCAKIGRARKALYDAERRRLLFNLPQKTKIRVNLNGRCEKMRRQQLNQNL